MADFNFLGSKAVGNVVLVMVMAIALSSIVLVFGVSRIGESKEQARGMRDEMNNTSHSDPSTELEDLMGQISDARGGGDSDSEIYEIDSCEEESTSYSAVRLSEPGYYKITKNLENLEGGWCIEIQGENIVIDGQGYTIEATKGIRTKPLAGLTGHTMSNITIKNINFKGDLSETQEESGQIYLGRTISGDDVSIGLEDIDIKNNNFIYTGRGETGEELKTIYIGNVMDESESGLDYSEEVDIHHNDLEGKISCNGFSFNWTNNRGCNEDIEWKNCGLELNCEPCSNSPCFVDDECKEKGELWSVNSDYYDRLCTGDDQVERCNKGNKGNEWNSYKCRCAENSCWWECKDGGCVVDDRTVPYTQCVENNTLWHYETRCCENGEITKCSNQNDQDVTCGDYKCLRAPRDHGGYKFYPYSESDNTQ